MIPLMFYPDITLEVSDDFKLKTLFSYSVNDTVKIGRELANILQANAPVTMRRDDSFNTISFLARPKTGKTYFAHAIANAFTGKTQPDFQSEFMNRDMPGWSIWRENNTYISNTDSVLEEWGQCPPPPPSLVGKTYRMVEHASAELQMSSTLVIGMSPIKEDDEDSPRKIDIYINPRCNVSRNIHDQLRHAYA